MRCLSLCLVAYTDAECQISGVSQAVVAWVHLQLPFAQETMDRAKLGPWTLSGCAVHRGCHVANRDVCQQKAVSGALWSWVL